MRAFVYLAGACLALALAGTAAWWWWPAAVPPAPAAPAPAAAEAPASAAVLSAAPAPAILHPIELLPEAAPASAAPPQDMPSALAALLGRQAVLRLLQTDGFVARFVATVDNLGRAHAAPRLWPVNPTAGRFSVDRQGASEVISADNGLRYTAFVLLVEQMDLRQAVALYARFYPQFQAAFEDLGYPGRYFNDRLVEVIDQLLATPEPAVPVRMQLPAINGPLQPQRPWVLYEFEDPALQTLVAGQKILLRMGPVNERRLKAKLAEIRQLLTAGTVRR
jgi:hypothetical protein